MEGTLGAVLIDGLTVGLDLADINAFRKTCIDEVYIGSDEEFWRPRFCP